MFTACFDASGSDHDQVALVVAGFVSSAKDWINFDAAWNARLAQDDLAYFHMVEFAHTDGEFKKWADLDVPTREKRRRALLSDLLGVIQGHAYRKFGCGISTKHWTAHMAPANIERFRINAYVQAALICGARVDNWALSERIKTPVELVFEAGDVGQGVLTQYLSARRGPAPIFNPKKAAVRGDGIVIPAFTPLQAADLLAYELLLGVRNYQEGFPRAPRFALGEVYKMPEEIKYFEPKDFENLDGMLRGIAALIPDPHNFQPPARRGGIDD
jgi:hypothetical protein